MSSHHIVREKQEPALLILGLNDFDEEHLGQLLEWSPTVLTTLPMAEKLISLGIKIDWLITDDEQMDIQSDIKHLPLGGQGVLPTALRYLIGQGYPAVNIVTDDFRLNDYQPYLEKINLVVFHHQQKIYGVTPGFTKWKPKGETIKLFTHPTKLVTSGLDKVSDLTFTTRADGFFTLDFGEPLLLIAELI